MTSVPSRADGGQQRHENSRREAPFTHRLKHIFYTAIVLLANLLTPETCLLMTQQLSIAAQFVSAVWYCIRDLRQQVHALALSRNTMGNMRSKGETHKVTVIQSCPVKIVGKKRTRSGRRPRASARGRAFNWATSGTPSTQSFIVHCKTT